MSKYPRLTYEDRIKIETLLDQGKTKSEIAAYLNRSKSIITNELEKYSGSHYRAGLAHGCIQLFT